ncbi:uncharacterized protein F5147DRAFT_652506 [Suillus discolor]|uniref:Uncharacterized protein n=1 Tax=Suillus discolor TaxID=1912936 RepID=A0A9P7F927_9AGAM|nr:uncharacterized protein F5147DRAFT_652506 [Suillus discolor]KAG2108911.1 hypothetical protein F5147DRAFT_652506 [Suillus discolor]
MQNINQEISGSTKSSASAAGQEDHSSKVIRAMNALNMDSDMVQGATAFQSDIIEAQLPVCLTPALSTVSSLSTTSTLSTTFKVPIQDVAGRMQMWDRNQFEVEERLIGQRNLLKSNGFVTMSVGIPPSAD